MATIGEKQQVLSGRGIVGRWDEGTSAGKYFYRERVTEDGKRKYKYRVIEGVTTLSEAAEKAAEAAIAMATGAPTEAQQRASNNPLEALEASTRVQAQLLGTIKQSKSSGISIEKATAEFMKFHDKRRRAEVIAEATYENKRGIIENHLTDYLNYKSITSTSQIKRTTFDDYLSFRASATRLVQQRECSVIGEWLKFLDDHEYIDTRLLRGRTILPRVEVRMTDRMANPAINPDDWRAIVNYVRNEWRHEPLKGNGYQKVINRSWFYRNLIWHYILLSKNSGMSPEEVLKLKWKNVEIKDVGRISKSKRAQVVEEIRTEGIGDVYDNPPELGGKPLDVENEDIDSNAWATEGAMGREERLISYIYTIRSKTKEAREIPCNQGKELKRWMKFVREHMDEHKLEWKLNANSYVFANPWNEMKPVSLRRVQKAWRDINDKLTKEGKLKGHRFSEKHYTLYSMRSTFIEDHLLKGTDIFLLARIAGHDVKELMQSYERLDIRSRSKEITDIQYGKTKSEAKTVNLFD